MESTTRWPRKLLHEGRHRYDQGVAFQRLLPVLPMATLRLEIVTPEAKTYSDDVESVVVPGAEGEFGVLPQHVALMTEIVPGELRIVKDGQEMRLAVGSGLRRSHTRIGLGPHRYGHPRGGNR